jgi:aspartate aminotransferase
MPSEAFGEARAEWIRFSLTTDRVETAAQRLVEFFG